MMKAVSRLIMLAAASATGSMLFAAEPESTPATQTDTGKPAADAKASKDDAVDKSKPESDETAAANPSDADKDTAKDAAKDGAAKASPQRFIPSEQVRADFDVSFPVDI